MESTGELNALITGSISWKFILAFLLYNLLGQIVSFLVHYWRKEKDVTHKFNWKYLWRRNRVRWALGILIPFIICTQFPNLQFMLKPIFDKFNAPYELNTTIGLFAGFFLDQIIAWLRGTDKVKVLKK